MKLKRLLALLGGVFSLALNSAFAQTDVTSTYLTNGDFSSTDGWTLNAGGGSEHSEGSGLIGTLTLNSKASTTDATHLATEYCFGFSARWNGRYTYYTQTAKNLTAGAYTLSYDVQDVNTTSTKYNMDNHFYVQVGETKYSDNATEWMNAGASSWTAHSISFTLNETSDITISFGYGNKENKGSGDCPALYVSHLKLEVYPFATASDYAALNSAITAAEGITWGFDADEYAPYNYVEVIQALAEAKAIDQDANNSQATVQALTATLNTPLTANVAEVNAIWDPSFEHDYSGLSGNIQPIGWYRTRGTTGDGYNVRLMNGSNAGLAATSSGKALFTKFGASYGWADGYTMPLNANTYYTISFVYGGWSDCKKNGYVTMTDPASTSVELSAKDLPLDAVDGDSNKDSWKNYSGIFKTNDAGNYVLGLLHSGGNTQSQYVYGDFVLKRTTAEELKALLNTEIVAAEAIDKTTNVGTGVFQTPASAVTALNASIDAAKAVYNNVSATTSDVETAMEDIKTAVTTYKATVNAPESGKRYYLKVATSGHAKENNAAVVSLGETSANNPTGYSLKASAAPATHLAQAFIFTQVSDNSYNISIELPEGMVYLTYGSLNGSAAGWATQQIQATTNAENKGEFRIEATSTANVFKIFNPEHNDYIDCQDGGSLYTDTNISKEEFTVEEASEASVAMSGIKAGKYATRIFPFKPTLPTGIEAYRISAVDGATLTLKEVAEPEANVPYLLKNTNGEDYTGAALTGYGTAADDSYTSDNLTGTFVTGTYVPKDSYVMQTPKSTSKQGFYQVDADDTIVLGQYRAYLTVPAGVGVKSFILDGDETDGIRVAEAEQDGTETIYTLSGQRVQKAQKGIYIVNGKKVVIK